MTQRLALLSNDVDDATAVVETLRNKGYEDENIYVVCKHDIILEDLPEADPRQYSDLVPAAKRGAGLGGALGLFAGVLMATVPAAGIAVGGGAISALAAGGAAFGAWASSLVGISLPNSKLEEFHSAIDAGRVLTLVDVEDDDVDALIADLRVRCRFELMDTAAIA